MRFVLVHSPAVGPSTWRWVGEALQRSGHEAVVPDLRECAVAGDPFAFARAAAISATNAETNVVCHSGAGALLPLVAAAMDRAPRTITFVDAGIPAGASATTTGGDFLAALRGLAVDGVLPAWSRWWGGDVLNALVSDRDRRAIVRAELPRVPVSFYEKAFAVPSDWRNTPCAFLLLSEAYRFDATLATALGWPVFERISGHLEMINAPDEIAALLCDVTNASGGSTSS
jgi:hypothetical protein